jgi:hypothetical protein
MATPGSAEESFQLAEHYRQLTDEELIELSRQKEELTEAAQQALSAEILSRRLTIPLSAPKVSVRPTPPDIGDQEDEYAEDRELVEVRTVWSERDARQVQQVLNTWGIPFFMGTGRATRVDDVTSHFADGVSVAVMRIASMTTGEVLQNHYSPQDEPPELKDEQEDDSNIHCPKCHSTDVMLDEVVGEEPNAHDSIGEKYQWTCESCCNKWEDDGVETKN